MEFIYQAKTNKGEYEIKKTYPNIPTQPFDWGNIKVYFFNKYKHLNLEKNNLENKDNFFDESTHFTEKNVNEFFEKDGYSFLIKIKESFGELLFSLFEIKWCCCDDCGVRDYPIDNFQAIIQVEKEAFEDDDAAFAYLEKILAKFWHMANNKVTKIEFFEKKDMTKKIETKEYFEEIYDVDEEEEFSKIIGNREELEKFELTDVY